MKSCNCKWSKLGKLVSEAHIITSEYLQPYLLILSWNKAMHGGSVRKAWNWPWKYIIYIFWFSQTINTINNIIQGKPKAKTTNKGYILKKGWLTLGETNNYKTHLLNLTPQDQAKPGKAVKNQTAAHPYTPSFTQIEWEHEA